MTQAAESFFVADGERFSPTEHAASPWNPATQAGGAPAGLLAALIEQQGNPLLRAARATVDILGPIPMSPGRVHVEAVRRGRATEYLSGSWTSDEQEVLRVGIWRVSPVPRLPNGPEVVGAVDSGSGRCSAEPQQLPDHALPAALFGPVGYASAMQWRLTVGGFDQPGPGGAWTRPRVPLLPGSAAPPIARLLMAAATANGLGSVLDLNDYLAIDVDITVHLERDPTDDWLHLDAATHAQKAGAGHVTSVFRDRQGPVGRGVQTLLITPRRPATHPVGIPRS